MFIQLLFVMVSMTPDTDKQREFGVVAQDVQKVIPEMVPVSVMIKTI